MFQICQCGVQPGYPHATDCPFPYYGNDEQMIAKWMDAHNTSLSLSQNAVGVSAETTEGEPHIVYGPEIDIDQVADKETLELLDAEWNKMKTARTG